MRERRSQRVAALSLLQLGLVLLLPGTAHAHLVARLPELDAWLARGEGLVIGLVRSAPRPCGTGSFPALLSVTVEQVIGLEESGVKKGAQLPLLVADEHDAGLRSQGLLVLSVEQASPLDSCTPSPALRLRTPTPAALKVSHPEVWPGYFAALRSLPPRGQERAVAQRKIWTAALRSGEPALVNNATLHLTGLDALPEGASQSLKLLAEDGTLQPAPRVQALRALDLRAGFETLQRLSRDPEPSVSEEALMLLFRAPPALLASRRQALRAGQATAAPKRPRDRIVRMAMLALLARSQDTSVREALLRGMDDRLFKVRYWAISGLGGLWQAGDVPSATRLRRLERSEPDPRLRAYIVEQLERGSLASGPKQALETKSFGLRMVLVLLGLLSLALMLLLPRLFPRGIAGKR